MGYFLITGATSGIGKALAFSLAKKGHPLILAARDTKRLGQLGAQLRSEFQVEAVPIGVDLSEPGSAFYLYNACRPYPVRGLINNAGMGLFGDFSKISMEEEGRLLQLNIISLHELSKYFIQDFSRENKGMVLNVASTAAFSSGPFMASYYASKAYVLSLTEALAEEFPRLMISCLAPGPVTTEFHQRAGISPGEKRLPTPQMVADYAVRYWFKGKVLIVPGSSNRLLLFLNRAIPRSLARKLVMKNQLKKKK